jgi:hypothetical protein
MTGRKDTSIWINMNEMNPTDEAKDDGDGDIEDDGDIEPRLKATTRPIQPHIPPRKRAGSVVLCKFYLFVILID